MPLQDLTPQLRTRLSRMERAVGWFVILAAALLVFGFAYYFYKTAERKGWFITKIRYETSISTGSGLKVGDPVKLMGFDVGEITRIEPNDPYAYYNITVDFQVKAPYFGYLWSDSKVKVAAADLLGHRYLELTKGTGGVPTVLESTNGQALGMLDWKFVLQREKALTGELTNSTLVLRQLNAEARQEPDRFYSKLTSRSVYWLQPEESPAVTQRIEKLVGEMEAALPNILELTNKLAAVLSNSAVLTSNLNAVALGARPAVSNLALATAHLNQPGALGEWLLPTNVNSKLDSVLGSANTALTGVNTNLALLAGQLSLSLQNLADITSNLNSQVQSNTNMLGAISSAVKDADDFVQGLKRFWLIRGLFKHEFQPTNAPPAPVRPIRSPKAGGPY